jgi:uncharacterized protein
VGGGGLIQFPAFLILVPGVPIPTLMGTNKLVSFTGTITALFRYLKNVSVPKTVLFPGLISSLSFAFLGAWCVSYLNKDLIRPLVVCLLVLVAGYTFFKKNLGSVHSPRLSKTETIVAAFATGGIIGFYDGFFGPGTGSFLIFIFISVFGFNFVASSASAKLLNCGTNLAALVFFVSTGQIIYSLAIPVAIFNALGSWVGANTALKKGSGFVRVLFLVMVSALILKISWDWFFTG